MSKFQQRLAEDKSEMTPLLSALMIVFVSFLIMSNVLANRMVRIGPFSLDAGNLTFPITYILSDLFSEVYGYKWSRRVTIYATILNLIFVVFIKIGCILPYPDYFDPSNFSIALNGSTRIVIASTISYYLGDLFNDKVFKKMKGNSKEIKGFGARALLSSLVGECVDSTIFCLGAFAFVIPISEMPGMIIINIIAKTGYEVIIFPVTYLVTKKVKMMESL